MAKTWVTKQGSRVTEAIGGRCSCFLVSRGGGCLLVDSGRTNAWDRLRAALDEHAPTHGRPSLLVLTHTHFDHAENAARLKSELGLRIAVHCAEAVFLEAGDSPLPEGSVVPTRVLMALARGWAQRHYRYAPAMADVVVDGVHDLAGLGFEGAVLVPTPGHSSGSMCLVVDREIVLVGDSGFGNFPFAPFPPFADDPGRLVESWRTLLDTGAELFLPAHGGVFTRDVLQRDYERRSAAYSGRGQPRVKSPS